MDVAIRDAMVPKEAGGTFFDKLRHIGTGVIEIEMLQDGTTPHIPAGGGIPRSVHDDASAAALKAQLDTEGVRVCALLIANDFASDAAEEHVEWTVRAARAAYALGAPVVRVDPLARDKTLPPSVVIRRFRDAMDRLVPRLPAGVDVGVENHGPVANEPGALSMLAFPTGHARVGVTLDTGNFYWYGHPLERVYELVREFAPRAKHTHLKNINYPPDAAGREREMGWEYKQYCCGVHEGNLDLRRVIRILRDAGYDRDLCIEDESLFKHPPEKRLDVLRREVEALREAMN